MAVVTNPCGGPSWETQPDGTVLVEGSLVLAQPELVKHARQTWSNWEGYMRAASAHWGVPLRHVLAIATTETGLWSKNPRTQAALVSPAGAVGVMQLMPATASMLGLPPSESTNPEKNIWFATKLLSQLHAKHHGELPLMAASYNAGGVRCSPTRDPFGFVVDNGYATRATQINNSIVNERIVPAAGLSRDALLLGASALVAAAGVGAAVAWNRGWLR